MLLTQITVPHKIQQKSQQMFLFKIANIFYIYFYFYSKAVLNKLQTSNFKLEQNHRQEQVKLQEVSYATQVI